MLWDGKQFHKFPTECTDAITSLFGNAETYPYLMLYFCLTLLLWEQPNVTDIKQTIYNFGGR